MNQDIILEISNNLNIKPKQVETVLNLLSEGNTIPFIARYRKEATGALDEEVIRSINEVYEYQVNLLKEGVILKFAFDIILYVILCSCYKMSYLCGHFD